MKDKLFAQFTYHQAVCFLQRCGVSLVSSYAKFGEDPSKDLGGDREHTNTQTNAARIIV